MKRLIWLPTALLFALGFPTSAQAGPGNEDVDLEGPSTEPAEPAIFGGQVSEACAWPTSVEVTSGFGLCSGTLIHPEIVLYAGHCGGGNKNIHFGNGQGGGFDVQASGCQVSPDYNATINPDGSCGPCDQQDDFAFCKLPYAVDIPVTPVAMGCELDELVYGEEVAIVGFGTSNTQNGQDVGGGTKRWGLATLLGISQQNGIAEISLQGEPHICGGDSGGGALRRYADGGWRTFGVTSTGTGDCNAPGGNYTFGLASRAVPWIESASGVEVSPCFDAAAGTWDMNPECAGFMANEPGAAFGSWSNGCPGGPVTGAVSTCGPPHDAAPDTDDPSVEIVNPAYGSEFPSGMAINIDVNAFDAGWGVKEVRLFIDGMDITGDTTEPYGWEDVAFPDGVYELTAQVEDHSGKIVLSAPVAVQFGEGGTIPPDPTSTSSTSSATEGDGGSGGEGDTNGEVGTGSSAGSFTTDAGFGDDEGGDSGCACDTDGNSGGVGALALLGLLGLRRRRD